jgi:hypothetical protein
MVGCWRSPNRYFENNGNGTFTDASDDIGLSGRIYNTTGMAVCDLNKDKLPDVVFNNEGQEAVVLLSNQAWFTDRATPKVVAVPTASPASASAFIAAAVAPGSLSGLIGIAVLALGLFCAFLLARSRRRGGNTVPLLALAVLVAASSDAGDWPTARGNPQRTGNVDDKPGPKAPKVLWVHKAKEHYVASPVSAGKALYLATIGGLNTGVFQALALDARVPQRVLWSKSAPYIVRPTVCAPAVADGLVVFGDGMHQTDDAVLYCLQADTGMPVDARQRPRVHLRGRRRRALRGCQARHARWQGTGPGRRRPGAGEALERPGRQVRTGEEERPRPRHPAQRRRAAQSHAEACLADGQRRLAH